MKRIGKVVISSMVAGLTLLAAASPAAAGRPIKRGGYPLKTQRLLHVACVAGDAVGFAGQTGTGTPLDALNIRLAQQGFGVVGAKRFVIKPGEIRSVSAPVFITTPNGEAKVCVTLDAEGRYPL